MAADGRAHPDGRRHELHLRPVDAVAGDELYDMSGNVKEWVTTDLAAAMPPASRLHEAPCYELRGGAYNIASFVDNSVTPAVTRAPGLQCDASTPGADRSRCGCLQSGSAAAEQDDAAALSRRIMSHDT